MKTRRSSLTTAVATAGAVVASGTAYALLNYPPCASLGTTREERDAPLPGDDLIPDGLQSTRAITIQAPPDAIWPWLVQMGQDRGGFYSHDWLERLFGAEIHNADRIHSEWQTLAVGDMIHAKAMKAVLTNAIGVRPVIVGATGMGRKGRRVGESE